MTPAWKNQIDSLYQRRLRSLQAVDEAIASLYEILQVPEYLGLRTPSCTYVKYSNGESELYNLQHDPNQLQNLSTTVKPNIIRKFARRLRQLRLCRGERCRVSDVKPLPPCDS